MTTLSDVLLNFVDCVNRTAPESESGSFFAVGTPAMRGNTIDYSQARRIDRQTFDRWTRRLVPKEGDILLAREAPVGPVVRVPAGGHVAAGQRTLHLRANPARIDPQYLYYYLIWGRTQSRIMSLSMGSTVPHLRVADARTFDLDGLRPRTEQRAIAEVLGALDDKIAANRRVVELADELVSATVGSNLREEVPLWEAVQVAFGEPFAGAHFSEEGNGRPLIRIRDLKSQACAVWTTEARPNEIVVNPGEVLVGMDAEFTATRWSGPSGLLNQRVLLAGSDQLGKPIVRESLKAPLARLERSKSGTTVIHLNKADLLRESVLIPAAEDLAPLRAIVDPVWDRAVAAEREDQVLASTRDELLPLLMSGRITVGAASSRVEEVV